MEKFYFEIPSIERKKDILEYLNEFVEYKSDINGIGVLDKIIFDNFTFEKALEMCLKMEDENYARSVNRCPGKVFLLIREYDNRIVGNINLRWNLSETVLKFGGHIGYSIRPTERGKGYNKINLYMVLLMAKKIGLDKVMLDCCVNNLASNKTIKALDGVLERCEIDPWDNELTNVYWIDVNKSLKKYENVYKKYIKKNVVKE